MPTKRQNKKIKVKKGKKISFFIFIGLVLLIPLLAVYSVKELQKYLNTETTLHSAHLAFSTGDNAVANTPFTENAPGLPAQKTDDPFLYWMDSLTQLKDFIVPTILSVSTEGAQLIDHRCFMLLYDEESEQAQWVAHRLDKSMLSGNHKRRNNNFKTDPNIIAGSAHPNDYLHSGFDRGHLAPAGDFVYSSEAMESSFYMSNISPQNPSFNRGVWKKLEEQIRSWAKEHGSLVVVTGPIIEAHAPHIGQNKVRVPDYFYKVILDIHPPEYKMIAFLLKNEKSNAPLLEYAITVDSLERFSGIDFFPMLPDSLENRLESSTDYDSWFK
ncbi:DNA/RNA non-specific endonuclease [Negadavirga shengliensis]|uniref:Endonuclease n=1 Tax=Negadavirga shengliensis TaxID=1389218 RepID=A0ABV9T000_9BACT